MHSTQPASISQTVAHAAFALADTHDAIGPLGAKGMGGRPINPVAPALANAIKDATGRFRQLA